MTAEQNFDWLDKQVEGLLNDFEGGESTLQETKNGFYEIIFDKLIKQIQEQQDYKQEIDEACKKAKIEECEYWREIIFSPEQQAIKPTISLTDFQLRIVELSPKESE